MSIRFRIDVFAAVAVVDHGPPILRLQSEVTPIRLN